MPSDSGPIVGPARLPRGCPGLVDPHTHFVGLRVVACATWAVFEREWFVPVFVVNDCVELWRTSCGRLMACVARTRISSQPLRLTISLPGCYIF